MSNRFFIITIDTEGDDLWSTPFNIKTKNAAFLPRFQALCERYAFKPTYLTNYEMLQSEVFCEFAEDGLQRDQLEVGMHLHAWNSPPLHDLTGDDHRHHPFLIEYPDAVMRDKVKVMTDGLENRFGVKMRSHRAGRWSFDTRYARILTEMGYEFDCSVVPHVSRVELRKSSQQFVGTDYRDFPEHAYRLGENEIDRPGLSSLIEVPMTVIKDRSWVKDISYGLLPHGSLAHRVLRKVMPRIHWLRPDGRNLARMANIVRQAELENREYIEFMLHSSELMPGGSPRFKDAEAIDKLYDDLEALFTLIGKNFKGATLQEYGSFWKRKDR